MGYAFKINSIGLANGESKEISFVPTELNIIVGANSSGKSHLLKEIRDSIYPSTNPNQRIERVLLTNIVFSEPNSYEELDHAYNIDEKMVPTVNGYKNRDYCPTEIVFDQNGNLISRNSTNTIFCENSWHDHATSLFECQQQADTLHALKSLLPYIGPSLVSYSGTIDRPLLAYGEKRFGPNDPQTNTLSAIQDDYTLLAELSSDTKQLFGVDICLDTYSSEIAQFRIGDSFENYRTSKRNDRTYFDDLTSADLLKDAGDGIKGFVAAYLTLKSAKRPIILLDEPEAFLHPRQAYELGKIIGESKRKGVQIFVTTHSADLVRGIFDTLTLENASSYLLLKLNGRNACKHGRGANVVSGASLHLCMQKSNVSRAAAINGLFSEEVILVESDSDRIIYNKILNIMGINKDALFIPTYSKDLMKGFIGFFATFGTPCRAIIDLDILNNWEKTKQILIAMGNIWKPSDPVEIQDFAQQVRNLKNIARRRAEDQCTSKINTEKYGEAVNKTQARFYKNVLPQNHQCPIDFREAVNSLESVRIKLLRDYRLLIVSTGELETVLEDNENPTVADKDKWLDSAIERLGTAEKSRVCRLKIAQDLSSLLG